MRISKIPIFWTSNTILIHFPSFMGWHVMILSVPRLFTQITWWQERNSHPLLASYGSSLQQQQQTTYLGEWGYVTAAFPPQTLCRQNKNLVCGIAAYTLHSVVVIDGIQIQQLIDTWNTAVWCTCGIIIHVNEIWYILCWEFFKLILHSALHMHIAVILGISRHMDTWICG